MLEVNMLDLTIERDAMQVRATACAEGELTPPPTLPAIWRVLNINARAFAAAAGEEGQLCVDGSVTMSVVYACNAGGVHAFESVAVFKHVVELDVTEDCKVAVNACVGEIDCKVVNNALAIKAIVELDCMAMAQAQIMVVAGLEGACIEQRKTHIATELISQSMQEVCLHEEVQLPRMAKNLLGMNAFARTATVTLEGTKAIADGCLRGYIAFCTPDGSIVQAPITLPFVAKQAVSDGALRGYATARVMTCQAQLVADELALVDATIVVDFYTVMQNQHEILCDAYSTQENLVLQSADLSLKTVCPSQARVPLRVTMDIPGGMPAAERVLLCSIRSLVDSSNIDIGSLSISGRIFAYITYASQAGEIFGFFTSRPFTVACENISGKQGHTQNDSVYAWADCELTHVSTGAHLEVQTILDVCAQVFQSKQEMVITEVCTEKMEDAFSGIGIYFPTQKETMWEVGKRFGIGQAGLAKLNPSMKTDQPVLIKGCAKKAVCD